MEGNNHDIEPNKKETEESSSSINPDNSTIENSEKEKKTSFLSNKFIVFILLLSLAFISFKYFNTNIPHFDTEADKYFKENIKKDLIVYGSVRIIDGIISVFQESSISATPAGVGLNIAVGQLLSPLQNIIERTCNLLETSIIALGIMKILYEISVFFSGKVIGICLFFLSILTLIGSKRLVLFSNFILKLIVVVLLIRVSLPVTAFTAFSINDIYFNKQINTMVEKLKPLSGKKQDILSYGIDEENEESNSGFFSKILGSVKKVVKILNPITYAKNIYNSMKFFINNIGSITETIIGLMVLYISKFLVEVIIIPIGVFYTLLKIIDVIFKTSFSDKYRDKFSKTFRKKEKPLKIQNNLNDSIKDNGKVIGIEK